MGGIERRKGEDREREKVRGKERKMGEWSERKGEREGRVDRERDGER